MSREADEASYLYSVLDGAGRARSAGVDEAPVLREGYLVDIPDNFIRKRMLTNVPLEHAYLLKEAAAVL